MFRLQAPGASLPGKGTIHTHSTVGSMGTRDGQNVMKKIEVPVLVANRTPVVKAIA
jgi:hypothetical protein